MGYASSQGECFPESWRTRSRFGVLKGGGEA